jgi:UDP-N-acetylmuramyl pentapeptide phosphotransferase/UDP-N-acetylglucosamine-1-phosphate transferase
MEQIIIGGILAFGLTFLSIPIIIKVANAKKLFDEPDDNRKIHKSPIPSLGGLGMFIGFSLSLLLTLNFDDQQYTAREFQFYIAAILVTFFIGIKDDILILSAGKKFIGQLIVASILIFKAKLLITNMHGFLGIYQIDTVASHCLTMFSLVVIVNAFNLIDGVDGLAGSLGLFTSVIFGTFFFINGNIPYAVLGFGFAGSLLAFLKYNFHPASIFMGDTGSLMIGLINSILVIKFIELGPAFKDFPVAAAPAVGFGIILLPLMDTLRVFAMRILKGRSPFSPDRNHIHHLLLDRGFNHRGVTFTCVAATAIVTAISFYSQNYLGTTRLIGVLILSFFVWVYILYIRKTRYKLRVIKGEAKDTGNSRPSFSQSTVAVRLLSPFTKKAAVVDED